MKKILSLSAALFVFVLAGCDLITGTDPTDSSTSTSTGVTAKALVGTWKKVRNDDNNVYTTQYTFYSDGTFINLSDECLNGTHDYDADKGTYVVDSKGNVTFTCNYYANDLQSFSIPDDSQWVYDSTPYIYTLPALIIGDQLYLETFFIAQGAVSGIVGTWAVESMHPDINNNDTPTYTKIVLTFNNDGTMNEKTYNSTTGNYGLPEIEYTLTYTYSNGSLQMKTPEGQLSPVYKVIIFQNKYLILGNETSATANAYFKQ